MWEDRRWICLPSRLRISSIPRYSVASPPLGLRMMGRLLRVHRPWRDGTWSDRPLLTFTSPYVCCSTHHFFNLFACFFFSFSFASSFFYPSFYVIVHPTLICRFSGGYSSPPPPYSVSLPRLFSPPVLSYVTRAFPIAADTPSGPLPRGCAHCCPPRPLRAQSTSASCIKSLDGFAVVNHDRSTPL